MWIFSTSAHPENQTLKYHQSNRNLKAIIPVCRVRIYTRVGNDWSIIPSELLMGNRKAPRKVVNKQPRCERTGHFIEKFVRIQALNLRFHLELRLLRTHNVWGTTEMYKVY